MSGNFNVDPADYSRPIRIYADVDGVLSPFFRTLKDETNHKPVQLIMVNEWKAGRIITSPMHFQWHEFAARKYVEWSKHSLIDFVWLTSWRDNAPQSLDPLLGVESLGSLPWSNKMSDYNQSFKKHAIEEDQADNPSRFIWLDDMANKIRYGQPLFADWDNEVEDENGELTQDELIPASQYLSITTDMYDGLTVDDAARVDAFIASVALECNK